MLDKLRPILVSPSLILRRYSESMYRSLPRMVSKESAVKKYIVTLSDTEREQLTALIHNGKHAARKLLKARILLKAPCRELREPDQRVH